MKRITKTQKEIVNAHIEAFKRDNFDIDKVKGSSVAEMRQEIKAKLVEGKTLKQLIEHAMKKVSIASQLIANVFDENGMRVVTRAMEKEVNRVMKSVLNDFNIK